MRYALFSVIVALPAVILTWVIARGTTTCPEVCAQDGVVQQTASGEAHAGSDGGAASPAPAHTAEAGEIETPADILTAPLTSAKIKGEVETYGKKGLFEYINGGAPAYIDRNFRRLAAAEMVVPDGGELTCDIYDMSTPEDAKAMFDAEDRPDAEKVAIGDGARKASMSLVLRKGRFYIKLTSFDAKAEAVLPQLAAELVKRIS